MQAKTTFAVIGIGENTSEAIRALKAWGVASGWCGAEWFSWLHINTGTEVAALPLDETWMAVLLFEANDKEQVSAAREIASKVSRNPHALVVGIAAGSVENMEMDCVACISGRKESLTDLWINAAKVVTSPVLIHCMTSLDYYNDLRTVLAQSGPLLTYAGGEHDSIVEAVEELRADECWITISHSKRQLLSIHATSATLATMKEECFGPIASLSEQLETAGEVFKWGIYDDKGVKEGMFRLELIATNW